EVCAIIAEGADGRGQREGAVALDRWAEEDSDTSVREREGNSNARVRGSRHVCRAVEAAVHDLAGGAQGAEPRGTELRAVIGAQSHDPAIHALRGIEWAQWKRELLQPPREQRRDQPATRHCDRAPLR